MNNFQNKTVKKQYIKCKLIVKKWEDEFFAKHDKLPTKADIKQAPVHVRESYNKYYKIKTEILASQILNENLSEIDNIVTDIDGKLLDSSLKSSICLEENKSVEYNCDISISDSIKHVTKNIGDSGGKTKEKIDDNTWGVNLNIPKKNVISKQQECSSINIFSQKLFKGSKFNKRNPRKSSSSANTHSVSSDQSNQNLGSQDLTKLNPVPNLNLSAQCNNFVNENLPNTKELNSSETSLSSSSILSSSLLSSCSLIVSAKNMMEKLPDFKENTSGIAHKVSLIQEIVSSPSTVGKALHNYHEDWVDRCIEVDKNEKVQRNSDSGFYSIEDSLSQSESKTLDEDKNDSDDDVIYSSDNELNESSQFGLLSVKRKSKVLGTLDTEQVFSRNENVFSSGQKEAHVTKKVKLEPSDSLNELAPQNKENTKLSVLEKKIKMRTLNENYVKINLERKTYVRGKKTFNFSKYKKQKWKKDKKMLKNECETGGVLQCFKCGENGHFSRQCKKQKEDKLLEVDNEEDFEDTLPGLDEAKVLAEEKAKQNKFRHSNIFTFEKPPEEIINYSKVDPLYQLKEDGSLIETPLEVYEALQKFGYSKFRPGQEEAIMRMLSGLSTLLIISTGGGKSLCYQLPAYLYAKRSKCITLVISPLLSLMEDQVSASSSFFKLGCLHTGQTQKQRDSVIEDTKKGKLHALLVSPEAIVQGNSSKNFGRIFEELPAIAFACIDEVHCISQWSHNFRPSYLLVNKVLREKFGITTILGLTATASVSTIKNITRELGILEDKDVIKDVPVPNNLILSVSRDENKDDALIKLLQSSEYQKFNAILIYCTRRDDCERLAVLIRTVLQNLENSSRKDKNKRLSWTAESYHAGMAPARRKQVQKAFMNGNLRIVVATVAFGMGINKQDIRAVIHYNMPKDFESYVQELGRAGRDGMPAFCHLFLDSKGQDINELKRYIYANSIDRHVLRKLLEKVFIKCDCKEREEKCETHESAFHCDSTIQELDIPEENIHTLLCYLELHEKKFIKVLSPSYINCRIKAYKGMSQISAAAAKCPPLAYVCALNAQSKKKRSSVLEFNVIHIANKIGWNSSLLKRELKNLEWEVKPSGTSKRSGISVEFYDLGFRVLSKGNMSLEELDETLENLIKRVEEQEKRSSHLLHLAYCTFEFFSFENYVEALNALDQERSNNLKNAIRHYFKAEKCPENIPLKNKQEENFEEELVATDVQNLLSTYRDNNFNARAVARIFHGIQSPNYPASLWFNCRFWRKHLDKDFNKVLEIAKLQILRWRFFAGAK